MLWCLTWWVESDLGSVPLPQLSGVRRWGYLGPTDKLRQVEGQIERGVGC